MDKNALMDELNQCYPMIGLSADWVYQTWLISGDVTNGLVIFEDEDSGSYELLSFSYDDDEDLITRMVFSGSLSNVIKMAGIDCRE
ncbi:hypothetical protein [Aeromonas veronii]|uniref:hypothetical protein n=1 Tax=Aeromonas veronii TaxID=654 RepID=UPI000A69C9B0|nr:hypothetical protein [Aeromonas veronii]MBL0631578.1 hypothetical protein [Aeromonas veronii]